MLTKMFKMMKKGNKGFTLVELMVVVVIIGVLTAIAVPIYNSATDKAKTNAIAANLRIINGAIAQFKANETNELESIDDLVPKYIQTEPTGPKGVTYELNDTKNEAVAVIEDGVTINGLSGPGNTLAIVQAKIND